ILPNWNVRVAMAVGIFVPIFLYWVIRKPNRWLLAFFASLLLLPPIGGVSIAPFLALLGVLLRLVLLRGREVSLHSGCLAFTVFLGVLLVSIAFAAVYSGVEIAAASLARVGLLALSGFLLYYAYSGADDDFWSARRMTQTLLGIAVLAAAFAILDFYFQFP